jgi:hypothetical protein
MKKKVIKKLFFIIRRSALINSKTLQEKIIFFEDQTASKLTSFRILVRRPMDGSPAGSFAEVLR